MSHTASSRPLLLMVIAACAVMGLVDAVIQPGYAAKSVIKLLLFLSLPFLYAKAVPDTHPGRLFRLSRGSLLPALAAGAVVYCAVIGGYFALRNGIDFSALTGSLTASTGVDRRNFPLVALYISLNNSLLEEFFFRGFAFLILSDHLPQWLAGCFSAGVFALYHVAMMVGWFSWPVTAAAVAGLFLAGWMFNLCAARTGGILAPWLIHMCANFAINTVGLLLFAGPAQ